MRKARRLVTVALLAGAALFVGSGPASADLIWNRSVPANPVETVTVAPQPAPQPAGDGDLIWTVATPRPATQSLTGDLIWT
ncbi:MULTISPECIES: hypothetical protein [Streptomycetaceae]|uniref:Uncharacterized protein n=1 Tax=Kitasatospora herbaricolor TaxID=68217 RepID=A0ABZ1WAG5_9ACTN|nr:MULTISPECIES: hypothetical protein [Streptomycetaceae]MDQ0309453.1 hypothetical protein [Kitasatospora herbaricolor]OKI11740.1 hypothetical protein A6A07_20605 [Streptomyces sp. CB03911]GGV01741.1 hypothetical protein GCM10010495_11100 [Kitasatospora herbaricolor]